MPRDEFTQFQRRRLEVVAANMNAEMTGISPDIKANIFNAAVNGGDGEMYAILPDWESAKGIDPEIVSEILKRYDSKINDAILHRNPFQRDAEIVVARIIWETPGAFLVDVKNPVTLKNKTKSPFYADNAMMYAWPPFMNLISGFAQVELEMAMKRCNVIIGGEARGIPFATAIGKDLAKATGIARKEIKQHGTKKGVEGGILPGDVAVLIEDLTTDGGTKIPLVTNIRNMGAEITDILTVVDRNQGAKQFLKEKLGVDLHSLTNIDVLLEIGSGGNYITKKDEADIREYLMDPREWNINRGYGWPVAT